MTPRDRKGIEGNFEEPDADKCFSPQISQTYLWTFQQLLISPPFWLMLQVFPFSVCINIKYRAFLPHSLFCPSIHLPPLCLLPVTPPVSFKGVSLGTCLNVHLFTLAARVIVLFAWLRLFLFIWRTPFMFPNFHSPPVFRAEVQARIQITWTYILEATFFQMLVWPSRHTV